ncbi:MULTISPECIES: tRNA lysidine(34) synthetase TilS [Sphingomonas]|uniref:tRNA lysidine(34) synthetase TilS n=1 Tax=Sphingomonas TaxID=13687 RepID=UPI00082C0FCB|nr:tRNA lysidine(34) synthetase TilS [Sphingomonas sp. CCH10-B3]
MTLPTGAPVARFRRDVEALAGPIGDRRLALAVSGGPDSMAMLALAAAAFPGQVAAATVDHRLRAASADEAAMVATWCAQLGVPHATLAIHEHRDPRDNLHDWARRQRYRLLEHWAIDVGAHLLATAHHADDQAETFLMRAARGSGVAGLAGIRARQTVDVSKVVRRQYPAISDVWSLDLIRPLLGWRRHELASVVVESAIPFINDPSNADGRFDRTQFRGLLANTPLLDPAQLAHSAEHVAEAEAALRAMERWLWLTRKVTPAAVDDPDVQIWLDLADLPRELKRRLARAAIHDVRLVSGITRPDFTDATNIEPLLDALEGGKSATQAGIFVTPKGTVWRFSEAPPRRSH